MASRHRGDFTRGSYTLDYSTRRTLQELKEMGAHVVIAAKEALAEGAGWVVEEAKRLCPVSAEKHHAGVYPGALRDSIKAVKKRGGAEYEIEANAKNKNGIPYGQFVEFDPRIGGKAGGVFLYPAMDNKRAEVYNHIEEAIRNAIQRGY